MKNLTISLILMILSSSILLAQSNSDIDPNAITNPHATTFTDDLFDHQFDFICGDASGEAGIETNGDFIYTSKWNGEGFFCYEMDGTFLGWFEVPGTAAVRDMAYDGTYFYGAAASTALFEMDFVGQSGTLISTLTAAVATRACAYDAEYDGFWGNNWSDPITLYDRSGNILKQFDCGTHESYYGFARIYQTCEGPWLYGFAQSGGINSCDIVQIDPETGEETGVVFDAVGYSSTGTGIAGGLASFDCYAPGWWTILGIIQNENIFGVEGGGAGPGVCEDLSLQGILEPNTGFGLGIEDIIIKVKNVGYVTQNNFDVRYKVDGGVWITETVPNPLSGGETILYTFNQAYDFSEYGEYFIEAEVLHPEDENPDNNYADKTITNWDPSQWCNYSITMWDDYGDGWNGGFVQIFGDGVEYVNATLASGAGPETIEFLVADDSFLTAIWTAGGWPYECSYEIFDHGNNSIFQDGFGGVDPTGGDIGYASCEPPPPIDAGVIEIISPPEFGMLLGVEPVIIKVKNFGSETLSEIPVGFKFNEDDWVNEIIPGPLAHDEEVEYAFTDSVDLTVIELNYIVTCTFVPDDTMSINDCQSIEIYVPGDPYCDAWTNTEDEYIANVSMGLIDNTSGWQGDVADYTDLYTVVNIGIPEEIIVTNGNPWVDDKVTVWIDWNDDCVLDNEPGSNETYPLTNDGTGAIFTGNITVPVGAIEGPHRMRIRMTNSEDPFPCYESSYGEVEDYTIVVGDIEDPEISWDPASFDVMLQEGLTVQEYLIIGNTGPGSLIWNIEVSYPQMKTTTPSNINIKTMHNASLSDNDPISNSDWDYNCSEGSIISQPCPDYSNALTADEAAGYDFYQSFSGGGEIEGIRFWGLDAIFDNGWIPCSATEPKIFHIGFYADDGGQPGAMIDEFTLEVPRINTGDLYAYTFTMWEYEVVFPNSVTVVEGWFSVMALTDPAPCWFLTLNAPNGLGVGQQWDGTAWNPQDPMGFCLLGEIFIPWLVVNPLEGIINPQGSETVILDFNAGDWPAGTELNADLILTSNDPWYPEIIIPVEMTVEPSGGIQMFDLEPGYQFISSNLVPPDPDMIVLMEDILNENLDFVRNSQGEILHKIGPNWVNGIGDWIIEEGYLVKMFEEDSFVIYGSKVMPSTPILVEPGFQFVCYFPDTPMDALIAFETIICDNLDFIRNSHGQTLRKIGPNWINGIGDCQPQEGYLVKMFAVDILIYPFSCGNYFTDPRDEQIYNTVQIGDQCWMAENLNIGQMINGSEDMTDNGVIEKYCYDNDPENCEIYGGLYQWNEMMEYSTTPGVQGICPLGWYIPTDNDWKILEGTVDSQYPVGDPIWTTSGLRGFDAGLNLKSTSGWHNNGNGTDLYGFTALSGGYRNIAGNFYTLEWSGKFRSSSRNSVSHAWYRLLSYDRDDIGRITNYIDEGLSVRCLKNNSINHMDGRSSFDNLSIRDKHQTYELLEHKRKNFETVYFIFEGGNPAEAVYTLYIEGLEIGDEIAAFDGNILVGAIKINSQNIFNNDLPVFNTISSGNGYTSGNPIILKAWDKSENKEYVLNDYTLLNPYGDAWTENVFPSEDGEYSLLHFSTTGISDENEMTQTISIHPNPSEGIFNISIEGVIGKIQIKVLDIHGNDYRFFEIEETRNLLTKQIDLKRLAAGVYFINFIGKDFNEVKKIVVK